LGAGPAIRRADRTVTGWTASGSYEVTSRPIAGRRPAGRHVGAMTRGQSSWGSDPPNDVNTLTVKLIGYGRGGSAPAGCRAGPAPGTARPGRRRSAHRPTAPSWSGSGHRPRRSRGHPRPPRARATDRHQDLPGRAHIRHPRVDRRPSVNGSCPLPWCKNLRPHCVPGWVWSGRQCAIMGRLTVASSLSAVMVSSVM
jgi:hypothetical protein